MKNKSTKTIADVLAAACHVPIREVCVLEHNENYFKAYVHGTNWYDKTIYSKICKAWDVSEENIIMKESPKLRWPLGSVGYVITVKYS